MIEVLGATGNATAAAQAVGARWSSLAWLRQKDAEFDRRCTAASLAAHERLKDAKHAFAEGDGFHAIQRTSNGRYQLTAVREGGWTKRDEEVFFTHLRRTGNIAASARATGFDESSVWERFYKWPAFARRWEEVLDEASLALEFRLACEGDQMRLTPAGEAEDAGSDPRGGGNGGEGQGDCAEAQPRRWPRTSSARSRRSNGTASRGRGRRGGVCAEGKDIVRALETLEPDEMRALLNHIPPAHVRVVDEAWPGWAHKGQLPPDQDWWVWMLLAGRGFGKTRAGAEWVLAHASEHPGARIALVASTPAEARRVMIDGPSGLLTVARADEALRYQVSRKRLVFPSGLEAFVYSGANPEALRGPEHDIAWCDELAKWRRPQATWENLILGLRRGQPPRAIVTTTLRAGPVLKRILATEGTVLTGGATRANPHLPEDFARAVEAIHAGTRFGRQELEGVLIEEADGALWTRDLIEKRRRPASAGYRRIVVGVDPPASAEGNPAASSSAASARTASPTCSPTSALRDCRPRDGRARWRPPPRRGARTASSRRRITAAGWSRACCAAQTSTCRSGSPTPATANARAPSRWQLCSRAAGRGSPAPFPSWRTNCARSCKAAATRGKAARTGRMRWSGR
ncbi:MAG TPA: terminase family protein [Allosphingosinicella sp.]